MSQDAFSSLPQIDYTCLAEQAQSKSDEPLAPGELLELSSFAASLPRALPLDQDGLISAGSIDYSSLRKQPQPKLDEPFPATEALGFISFIAPVLWFCGGGFGMTERTFERLLGPSVSGWAGWFAPEIALTTLGLLLQNLSRQYHRRENGASLILMAATCWWIISLGLTTLYKLMGF